MVSHGGTTWDSKPKPTPFIISVSSPDLSCFRTLKPPVHGDGQGWELGESINLLSAQWLAMVGLPEIAMKYEVITM